MRIIDSNEVIRNQVFHVYCHLGSCYDQLESEEKYRQFFEDLKLESPNMYETILKLFFLDCYRFFLYRESKDSSTDLSESFLEIASTIQDPDDLWMVLEQNPSFLSPILTYSHFRQKRIDNVMKANLITMLPDAYANKFSTFHMLEKESFFGNTTIEDLHAIYDEHAQGDSIEIANDHAVFAVYEKLEALLIGNFSNYCKLLLQLAKKYYIWKKGIEQIIPQSLTKADIRLLHLIETKNLSEIAYIIYQEKALLITMLDAYFYYYHRLIDNLYQGMILDAYHSGVSPDVKIKLKEV